MKRTSQGLLIGLLLMGGDVVRARPVLARTDLEHLRFDPRTREVVVVAKGPITPLSSFRPAPAAWVIDFRNARFIGGASLAGMPESPITHLTIKQLNRKWVRITFHLNGHRGSPFSAWRMHGKTYRIKLRQASRVRPPALPTPSVDVRVQARPPELPIPSLDVRFRGRPLAVRAFDSAPLQRPAGDKVWRWHSTSQLLMSTNIAHFLDGPSQAAARLSYTGTHTSYQPAAKGFLVGHIEQATLRFAESRYDYGSLVTSMALSHPVTPWLHVFEGGAMMVSASNAIQALSFLDRDLFGGVGTYGNGPANSTWYGTLSADRMAARALRNSYYGQTLRLGYQVGVASTDVQVQGIVQRIDPMILSMPTFRAYAYSAMEREWAPGVRIGIRALLGTQQSPESFSVFTEGGPFLQATF